jgi:hypothetical protein
MRKAILALGTAGALFATSAASEQGQPETRAPSLLDTVHRQIDRVMRRAGQDQSGLIGFAASENFLAPANRDCNTFNVAFVVRDGVVDAVVTRPESAPRRGRLRIGSLGNGHKGVLMSNATCVMRFVVRRVDAPSDAD